MKQQLFFKTKLGLLWLLISVLATALPLFAQHKGHSPTAGAPLQSEVTNYVRGEFIVRLADGVRPDMLEREWCEWKGKPTQLRMVRLLVKPLNIYLFSFDAQTVVQSDFLRLLKTDALVVEAQNNHHVTLRSTLPNDPQFGQQWQYLNNGTNGAVADADIDADLAWDITTGGITAFGDTIVACVIDDGCAADHPDWGDNLWLNHAEIPDNNIDDDGNGYIDDYRGWNTLSNNDDIMGGFFGGGHGTPVAGIVGAQGNNGIGVSGVSWDVKVMIVVNGTNADEANVIAAYSYPLEMRTRYNETNGQEGAFVVSTNASWGIDEGDPADAPLWCAMYDELGAQGVLSCGATANTDLNVDVVGDLPTACPSDYLISVTNVGSNDVKITQAGYGLTTIDLGAFGTGTYTLSNSGNYAGFSGTSGATPHVTGAVALLYSVPCPGFIQLAKADPAAAAQFVKQAILNGTDANASLAGKCVTGGRLNLYNSVQLMLEYDCPGCVTPYVVQVSNIGTNGANVSWGAFGEELSFAVQYQATGTTDWTTLNTNETAIALEGLTTCEDYLLQVTAICSDTLSSEPSIMTSFLTDGCCVPPAAITLQINANNTVTASWESITAATQYVVQLLNNGNIEQNATVSGNSHVFSNLQACTEYSIQVASVCGGAGNSDFSAPETFITPGCGACTDNNYCASASTNVSYEWIAQVLLNTLDNTSGGGFEYEDYTNLSTDLVAGESYAIQLTPGYSGESYIETFRVWIDLNQNGTFEDQTERLLSQGTSGAAVSGTISIPATALLGNTRMRVSMKYTGNNIAPTPCEEFQYGQVEDYCVTISEASACGFIPSNMSIEYIVGLIGYLSWSVDNICETYTVAYGLSAEPVSTWQSVQVTASPLILDNLSPLTNYGVIVSCNCGAGNGSASDVFEFSTSSIGFEDISPNLSAANTLQISPNPFADNRFMVKWTSPMAVSGKLTWRLSDMPGRVVQNGTLSATDLQAGNAQISTTNLPIGVYWVEVLVNEQVIGSGRVVKIR